MVLLMPEDSNPIIKLPVIAVDGTAASGKGTLARRLAAAYGMAYLDTGLLYRFIGVEGLRRGVDLDRASVAEPFAARLTATLGPEMLDDPGYRTVDAGPAASRVAKHQGVREALLLLQKDFMARPPSLADGAPARGAVLDGRDIGTVIAPDAVVKFFVTAATEIRAKRRFNELRNAGSTVSYIQVLEDMRDRDSRDARRDVAPMTPAADAVAIDSSTLTADEVFALAKRHVRAKTGMPLLEI